ncbi:MAG: CehA/McbA family metallohydrolase [Fibrobacteres bacterium]|nr:CehA/McbA family metallohydrolase [Fibrobacterota bacterium]
MELIAVDFNGKDELPYLLFGFTGFRNVKRRDGDPLFRNTADEAAFTMPICKGADNRLTLNVSAAEDSQPQSVSIIIGGVEIAVFELNKREWLVKSVDIPQGFCTRDNITVVIKCSRYYRKAWEAGCLSVAALKFETTGNYSKESKELLQPGNVYFGDLHIHSNSSECANKNFNPYGSDGGSVEEIARFEREQEKCDFMAVTDHIDHMAKSGDWDRYISVVKELNIDGKFAVIPAYEWTSSHSHGHRNVYYKECYKDAFDHISSISSTPRKLWELFKSKGMNAFTIPHHPNRIDFPMNWDDIDSLHQPLVEIYSQWGSSESFGAPLQETIHAVPGLSVQDALTKGHRIGFVGGSDSHVFGLKERTFDTPHNRTNRGLTAVFADSLSRESIFDALQNRRCYATTGARIELDFRVNGNLMGSVLNRNYYNFQSEFPLCITCRAKADTPIAKVELIHNGAVIYTYDHCLDNLAQFAYYHKRKHPEYSNAHLGQTVAPAYAFSRQEHMSFYDMYFYVRVTLVNRHMAWSSPVFYQFEKAK